MPETASYSRSVTIDNDTYTQILSATGNAIERASPSVAAAKTGALTTRTDNDTGELTMDSGHGITTGVKLDVFWNGGSRRNMTVGTVATNAVPIDGGSGDNLPADETAVTAMVATQVQVDLDGDDLEALASFCPVSGWVVYRDNTDAVLLAHQILPNLGGAKVWVSGDGVTNPLAGVVVENILFSHGDSTQAQTMKAVAVH